MSFRLPMDRLSRIRPGAEAALLTLISCAAATGSWAAGAADLSYPPAAVFRSLQLLSLGCSRDNSPGECEQVRSQANGLLDHPRLSSACKDTLWALRQGATTETPNTLERRDRIDRAARDLTLFCRQPNQASSRPGGTGAGGSGPSGGGPAPGGGAP